MNATIKFDIENLRVEITAHGVCYSEEAPSQDSPGGVGFEYSGVNTEVFFTAVDPPMLIVESDVKESLDFIEALAKLYGYSWTVESIEEELIIAARDRRIEDAVDRDILDYEERHGIIG